jgi:hypothetical protein
LGFGFWVLGGHPLVKGNLSPPRIAIGIPLTLTLSPRGERRKGRNPFNALINLEMARKPQQTGVKLLSSQKTENRKQKTITH